MTKATAPSTRPPINAGERRVPTRGSLRQLILAVIKGDSDLEAFCLNHYKESVDDRFTNGLDRVQKASILLRRVEPRALLDQLREDYPAEVLANEHVLRWLPRIIETPRRRALVGALAGALVASAALWRAWWVPSFEEGTHGVVIGGPWLARAEGKELCDDAIRLHPDGARAVRCVDSIVGVGDLVSRSRRAGARVVAEIDADGAARITQLGPYEHDPILGGTWRMELAPPAQRRRAPTLLDVLALQPDLGAGLLPCPEIEQELDYSGLLTLFVVPRCLSDARRAPGHLTGRVCSATTPQAEKECALGRFLGAQAEGDPKTARGAWESLAESGTPALGIKARIQLALLDCREKPREVADNLAELDHAADRWARILLTEVAACAQASPKGGDLGPLVAEIERRPVQDADGPVELRIGTLVQRARYRGMSRPPRWNDGVADYEAAYGLDSRPVLLLSQAEYLLHDGMRDKAKEKRKAASTQLDEQPWEVRLYAAEIDWAAARLGKDRRGQADAAIQILRLYGEAADGKPVIEDDPPLRALLCADPKKPCPYDQLRRPKSEDAKVSLQRSLDPS